MSYLPLPKCQCLKADLKTQCSRDVKQGKFCYQHHDCLPSRDLSLLMKLPKVKPPSPKVPSVKPPLPKVPSVKAPSKSCVAPKKNTEKFNKIDAEINQMMAPGMFTSKSIKTGAILGNIIEIESLLRLYKG